MPTSASYCINASSQAGNTVIALTNRTLRAGWNNLYVWISAIDPAAPTPLYRDNAIHPKYVRTFPRASMLLTTSARDTCFGESGLVENPVNPTPPPIACNAVGHPWISYQAGGRLDAPASAANITPNGGVPAMTLPRERAMAPTLGGI